MENDKQLPACYGLKWNPFLPDIPVEALWHTPQMDNFVFPDFMHRTRNDDIQAFYAHGQL